MAEEPALPKKEDWSLRDFFLELLVYAVFIVAYFLLVLHLLGPWLKHLFDEKRTTYAVVSLALIIGQGVVLESVTRLILGLIRRSR